MGSFEFLLLTISIFSLILATIISPSIAKTSPQPHALVLPVYKDPSTLQYVTTIGQRTPIVPVKLTVDLGGQFMWVNCEKGYTSSTHRPSLCGSALCEASRSAACSGCFDGPKPGCIRTCSLTIENHFIRTSTIGDLGFDAISVRSTDGANPGPVASAASFPFTCGYTSLLEGLASGVNGMFALGRNPVSVPSQIASVFRIPQKFAMCLTPPGADGVIFFGNSPYFLLPRKDDISKSLIYTKLVKNPVSTAGSYFVGEPSAEYFIVVRSITINNKTVPLNTTLLDIHKSKGGTKISTVNPYTVMESSIYKAVTGFFVKQLAGIPRVAAVAPFKVCYSSKSLGSTRVGPAVPSINLVLDGKSKSSSPVTWMIFGANSMVPVNDHTLCLGFLDGGLEPRTSIVIGGFQLENNLLEFDLERSMLGFTSTLLFRQTNCANFNFTSIAK